jgi:hypothetical protein
MQGCTAGYALNNITSETAVSQMTSHNTDSRQV